MSDEPKKGWLRRKWDEDKEFRERHKKFHRASTATGAVSGGSALISGATLGPAFMGAVGKERKLSEAEAKSLIEGIAGKGTNLEKWDRVNAAWGPMKSSGKRVRYSKSGTVFYHPHFLRPSIIMHEAGHAKAYKGLLGKTKHFGAVLSSKGHVAAPVAAAILARKELKEGKKDEKLRKAVGIGGGTLAAARLIPEAEASLRGLKHVKFKRGKLPLALAFGTYVIPAAAAAASPHIIAKLTDKELERQVEGKIKEAGRWLKVASALEKTGVAPYRATKRYVKRTPKTLDKLYRTYLVGRGLEHQREVTVNKPKSSSPGKLKPAKTA